MAAWSQLRSRRPLGVAALLLAAALLARWRIRRGVGVHKFLARATKEELELAERKIYEDNPDGSKTLLVPFRGRVSRVIINTIPDSVFQEFASKFTPLSSSNKPGVDKAFLGQLRTILELCFPGWTSKETLILLFHSFFLVMRTLLSVVVARLDGRLVKNLVSADGKGFLRGLCWWFLLAIPSTYTNSMLRHLQGKLSLRIRTRLTRYAHDLYLSNLRYFRSTQFGLEGTDQYIAADIASFGESITSLYGNVAKPVLDIVIFTSQISRSLGFRGSALMALSYYVTIKILRASSPGFAKMASVERHLEGKYRNAVSRISREVEEIAFYGGGYKEREILWDSYLSLIKHINSIYKIRIVYEWIEDFVIKYMWSAAGYGLIAVPIFLTRKRHSIGVHSADPSRVGSEQVQNAIASRTERYIAQRRLLLSLSDAGSRLMFAYKDMLQLAGLTARIYNLFSTLHSMPPIKPHSIANDRIQFTDINVVVNERRDVDPDTGHTREETTLVKDLNFQLTVGDHLMITGPNGVGKSAIARVLKGLWAARGGSVTRPADCPSTPRNSGGIFFVPQRAYHVQGTLLDQLIYPNSLTQHEKAGRTENELREILQAVHLEYLPEREGGWFTKKEWKDVLSGGEKQRMALGRVLYHKPNFAVLDECTSAVSSDVEGSMYQYAKDKGISLITISLRQSLAKYHTHVLTISESFPESWNFEKMGSIERQVELDREIADIEEKLKQEEVWRARVEELRQLLSVTTEPSYQAVESVSPSYSDGISLESDAG